jgi:peptide deformylase
VSNYEIKSRFLASNGYNAIMPENREKEDEKTFQIIQNPAKVLRAIAKDVPKSAIKSAKTSQLLNKMKAALNSEEDGVALAAPQIGLPERIFVVSPKAFLTEKDLKEVNTPGPQNSKIAMAKSIAEFDPTIIRARTLEQKLEKITAKEHLVYINPAITRRSKETRELEEGCLSVRWKYGRVKRHTRCSIRAYDQQGKPFTRGASGLLAQIFQHETDHLDGVLFTDKAKDLRDLPPKNTR